MSDVQVFRVVDRGSGRTMRSRRTGALALFEDVREARRSANAYRGYYGHAVHFGVQVLEGGEECVMPVPLNWKDVE